jgi:hypothetical protein
MKSRKALSPLVALFLLVFFIAGCASSATPGTAPAATSAPAAVAPRQSAGVTTNDSYASGAKNAAEQPASIERLVIRNADLSIAVADPAGSMTAIMNMANGMGGYVVSSKSFKARTQDGSELPQASITVRIPAAKLDDALASIHKLTADPTHDIKSENITGQDVTAEYVDLQSKLTSLQNTQQQLVKIQDSATKTEDVLNVFNQISAINQQIEQVKGQINYYENSAAMSAVNVQLLALASINPISIAGWQPVGVVRDAFQALINVGKGLLEALIWLVIFVAPIVLVFYFPGRWLWRAFRRWQKRSYPQPQMATGMPYPPQPPYYGPGPDQAPGGNPPDYPTPQQ